MDLPEDLARSVAEFVRQSRFRERGAVVTDLDGTAVLEVEGRVRIAQAVELGLKALNDRGHAVIIDSLRFPLSIIRSFGREWFAITNAPIPTVSLNGALLGRIVDRGGTDLEFEEIAATPLRDHEVEAALGRLEPLVRDGVEDLLVFAYPRDWRRGELIWTPSAGRIEHVAARYGSASEVFSSTLPELLGSLASAEPCMLLLLVDLSGDRLMAYQHVTRSGFVTRPGVDKRFGFEEMARILGAPVEDCVGAGDTEMDTFLEGVGLAVSVGNMRLPFRGLRQTLRVPGSAELGAILSALTVESERGRAAAS